MPRRDAIIAASNLPPPVESAQRGPAAVRLQTGPAAARSRIVQGEGLWQTDPVAARSQIDPAAAQWQIGLVAAQWQIDPVVARSLIGPVVAPSPTGRRPLSSARYRLLALRHSIRGTGLRLAPPSSAGRPVDSKWAASPEAMPRAAVFMAAAVVEAAFMAAAGPAAVEEVASAVAADGVVEGR